MITTINMFFGTLISPLATRSKKQYGYMVNGDSRTLFNITDATYKEIKDRRRK